MGGGCVHGANKTSSNELQRANKTSSNELQRLFARSRESLPDGYTFHDFVTTGHTCVITTALQPSTSIYSGLIVESTLSLSKPSFSDLYWLECQSSCRYTHPVVPRSILDAFHHNSNHHIHCTDSHLLIKYDQWRCLWENKLSPFLKPLKTTINISVLSLSLSLYFLIEHLII